MMKKLKNLRRKNKKPITKKKIKAAKEDEEYTEPNTEDLIYDTEDLPQQTQKEQSPSRMKKSSKNREYEYTDYDDDYGGVTEDLPQYKSSPSRMKKNSKYNREYEYIDYNDEYGVITDNLPEQKQYKHSPSRMKKSLMYNRKHEYSDYDDEYGGKTEDLPQKYKHSPSRMKKSSKNNREYEYTDYNDEYAGKTKGSPQQKQYNHSPSIMKNSSRYNRDYKYYDEYGGEQNNYDGKKQIYDSGDEIVQYTTEDFSNYRRHPGRTREYYNRTETDDSDSDCLTCNSRREQRSDYTSEYPSEYQHEDNSAPRRRNMHRQSLRERKREMSETEIEESPYRQKIKYRSSNRRPYHYGYEEEFDYRNSPYPSYFEMNDGENPYQRISQEVYAARGPVDHKAFTHKLQHELEEPTSGSESEMDMDDDDDDDDEEGQEEVIEQSGQRTNQSQYQVFAANTGENRGVFRKQQRQNPRERIMSITEYDKSVQMVALKNERTTKSQDKSQSTVYLPIVVMDNTIKLPNSKVVNAKSILRTVGDKAEKPLETNMNVYLEADNGQGNIFQWAKKPLETNMNIYLETDNGQGNVFQHFKKPLETNITGNGQDSIFQQIHTNGTQEIITPTNIQVYTTQSTNSIPVEKKPSLISRIASKVKSKSKSDYPVQKSYINVAPSKTKPVKQKKSKTSIKSGGSKISISSSFIGAEKPNSPKGSAYYAKVHKKEMKDKKERKSKRITKSEESDSAILSVINPTTAMDKQCNDQQKNMIISNNKDVQTQKSIQRSISQTSKMDPTFKRNVPLLKQPSLNNNGVNESTSKNLLSKQRSLERQCSIGKDNKIITLKGVSTGQYGESKNVFDQSEAGFQPQTDNSEAASPKKKSFVSSLFHKKESKIKSGQSKDDTASPKMDPYTFNPDEYFSPTTSLAAGEREKNKEDTSKSKPKKSASKPKKSPSGKKLRTKRSYVEFSHETEEFQFWNVLSDSSAFMNIYQVAQYFLGLSIHGTLMEILRNSKQSD